MTHGCCSHTGLGQTEAWWQVDLRRQSIIERVEIIYRDERALARLAGFEIYLSDTSDWRSGKRCYQDNTASLELMTAIQNATCVGVGQYVTIYNDRRVKAKSWYWNEAYFELCEVYVFGCNLGKFGNGHCNDDCLNCLNNVCQPTSGACECDVGFYGDHCDQICPLYCKNNVCKMSNGQCVECDVGFFGNHCDQLCPGNCENHTCNKDSGLCTECISGFYGNVCNQACPDNCGNNVCSMQDGQCLIPLPERQTGDTCSYIGFYTGYAVLGAFLGISVCFNICLIVLFLRQAKKTKSPNEPPGTFGMHTIRDSSESHNYEGLDVTKVGNGKNIYDSVQE